VGRPDGSAKRAAIDGWRSAFERWKASWSPPRYYDPTTDEALEEGFAEGWKASRDAIREARERVRRSKAAHGQTAPDASQVK